MYQTRGNGEDQAALQTNLNKMQNWSDTWLLKLSVQKCKVMSYGRHADRNYTYTMVMNGQSAALDYEDHIKDLGVTFDEKLDCMHIAEKN